MKQGLKLSSFLILVLFSGCGKSRQQKKHTRPPIPVATAKVVKKNVPLCMKSVGRCKAYQEVKITAQVEGELKEVYFKSGQFIKQGEPLYLIDSRKYSANLNLANAELERANAQLAIDQAQLERSQSLVEGQYISPQQYETYKALVQKDKANISAAKSSIEKSTIDFDNCCIRAPFSGFLGKSEVDLGAIINPSQGLVSLKQFSPLYVDFFVSENDFVLLKDSFNRSNNRLKIKVSLISNPEVQTEGFLDFLDNFIDYENGIIRLRGQIANDDLGFWPGNTVKVMVELDVLQGVLTVPVESLKIDAQRQNFLYKVVQDGSSATGFKVSKTNVGLKQKQDDTGILEEGVAEGDTIVLRGNMMLGHGSDVIPMDENNGR